MRKLLATALLILVSSPTLAFELFGYAEQGEPRFLKWGDNRAQHSGGVVRWSLLPAGVAGDAAYCGAACDGLSRSSLQVENGPGQGFSAVSLETLAPRIELALRRWSRVSGLRFQRVADSGVALNAATAHPPATGDIRIGIFAFAGGSGAVGYAPPPNGGSGAGDVLFDAGAFYQFAAGAEAASYSPQFAPNDFDSLLTHEIGHALGLAHPAFDGSCPLMQVHPDCAGRINREPDPDDRAGMQFLYAGVFADGIEDG